MKQLEKNQTLCDCGHVATADGCTTGYGKDPDGRTLCFACCGQRDLADMIETGKATLYLTCEPAWKAFKSGHTRPTSGKVSNWPGTLEFKCHTSAGRHNMARYRYDVHFVGPDGFMWHGVTIGDNTQICHCKRTKVRA